MRKVILFMMVSLDGYFEGPDHDLSWHNVDEKFNDFVDKQNSTIDTILFGHRTYDMMYKFWPSPEGDTAPVTKKFMNETKKVVFTHRPFKAEWDNTIVISENIDKEVKKLKESPGKNIAIFGSNNLCVSLMEFGLVDEFRIMVNPVVIGGGTRLFQGLKGKTEFVLKKATSFKSGNVFLVYEPKR